MLYHYDISNLDTIFTICENKRSFKPGRCDIEHNAWEVIGGIWVVSEALTPKPSALYQLFTMMIRMDQSNCHLMKRFLWLLNIHEHESIFHFYFLHFSRICIIALIGTHQLKVSYPMAYWRNSLVGCFIDQWQRSSFQLSYYTVKCSLNMAAMCVRRTW